MTNAVRPRIQLVPKHGELPKSKAPMPPSVEPTTTREPPAREDRPYARYAFLNPYNLVTFAGLSAIGILSGHEWLTVLASGAEALFLIFAPGSQVLRRIWFDPAFDRAERTWIEERRSAKAKTLSIADRNRLAELVMQKATIERLARENASLAVEILHDELSRIDRLVDDFIDLAMSAERGEAHAATFDFTALRRSWGLHEEQLKRHPAGDKRRAIAEQNLAVLRQRRARYDDLCRAVQIARGQMDLVEQTFRLLADEILTMASPSELGGRIDELRIAVDAARETATDYPGFDDVVTLEEEDFDPRVAEGDK